MNIRGMSEASDLVQTGSCLSILLVEDDPLDAELSRHELEHFGHRVTVVHSGEEALACFAEQMPDLVVTDVRLPGMDGCELTRRLKLQVHPNWLPVLFLSGVQTDEVLVEAYRAGADDFITKPVHRPVLQAKLEVFRQRLQLQREALSREALLQRYRDQAEEEKAVAQHLMHRLVNAELLGDLSVNYWVRPAETYSGDLIAAARTPGGILHVLLADATGHGLAASLAVMPVTQPFYRMTEKGFGIDTIAREMNRKVRELLPVGRFVAATLVAVDSSNGSIQVWNGGNPHPFLISAENRLADFEFRRTHLPLGILDDDSFDAVPEIHFIQEPHQLVVYSDGVVEAENPGGLAFGRDGLHTALLAREQENRLTQVIQALDHHLAGHSARDDLSLLLVRCYHRTARTPPIRAGEPRVAFNGGNWQVAMSLSAEELRTLDPVPLLMGVVNQFNRDQKHSSQVFLILSELFTNALDHGVLRMDSCLKSLGQGFGQYLEERGRRLAALEEGLVEIGVSQVATERGMRLAIRVRDSGPGFDYRACLAEMHEADSERAPYGRGLRLVHSLCAQLTFAAAGNEVIAYYEIGDTEEAGLGQ